MSTTVPQGNNNSAVRDEWMIWAHRLIKNYPSWFVTITHEGYPRAEFSRKIRNHWLNRLNKIIYGNHYDRKGLGLASIFVLENQGRGATHQHGLVVGPELSGLDLRVQQIYLTAIARGFCKIEVPRRIERTIRYCMKCSATGETDVWLPRNWL